MMSAEFNEELLSALFDGELTGDERVLVERWLEQSPALRGRLEEYRELRKMFAELPQPAAPSDLRDAIRRQIASRPGRDPASPRPKHQGKAAFWRSRRAMVAAASVSCIAVLAVWTTVARRAENDLTAARPLADAARHSEAVVAASGESGDVERELAQSVEVAAPSPTASSVATGQLVDAKALRRRLLMPGQTPTPGEKLSYLDSIGEQPVVVTYSVVDVVSAFDEVQILLEREGIHSLDGSGGQKLSPSPGLRPPSVAIYMEAEPAQIDAVLKQLPVVFVAPRSANEQARPELTDRAGQQKAAARTPAPPEPAEPLEEAAFQFVVPIDAKSRQQLPRQTALQNAIGQQTEPAQGEGSSIAADVSDSEPARSRSPGGETARERRDVPGPPNGTVTGRAQAPSGAKSETDSERVSVLLILQSER